MMDTTQYAAVLGSASSFWELVTAVDSEQIKAIATEHTWLALLLCFASGILTSLTPCVYPMIPITINIFGRASQKHSGGNPHPSAFNPHTFFLSGVYVGGMAFTYSVMGLVAGMTGSLFGKVLQSTYMLGFLTLLFTTLAVGQMGVFKLALPASLQTRLSRVGDAESLPGIFLMGLFSGLIVSPCVGPVIAGILAFVFDTSNAFKGFAYFLSFSLGLGVLFLLIGGFSGVLSQLPRSGMWMMRINRLLASLMLIASGYYGILWAKQAGFIQKTGPTPVAVSDSIPWYTNEEEAVKKAMELKLPIFVDFGADWCEACHVLEKTVFVHPSVSAVLKSKFINLRIDVTESNDTNEKILQRFGVLSLPTLVFMDRDGKILETPRVHGVVTPEAFLAVLNSL